MFFNKIEIVVVSDWLQPCTGYIAIKKPFCLIFRIPTLRLLSSHWSTGLLIWSLIGPFDDNRSHDVRTFQYSPLLTRQSRLISDYYLLLLFTIYLHFLLFRRLRRKYKIQRFCVVANLFSGTLCCI